MLLKNIKANPNNPRLIKDEKFQQLVNSIKSFPKMMELRPIIVDEENMVLGGNMRLKALQELGYKEIPENWVKSAEFFTPDELKEFVIKDNVGFGEWDWDMLANEWDTEKLTEWGLDIPDFALNKEAIEDDYEIPDEIETDIVLGDLFEIGQHRLLCGDSLNIENIAKLLNGVKPDMVYADPPYGIEAVSITSKKVGGGGVTKFGATGGGGGGAIKAGKNKFVDSNIYSEIIGDDTTNTARDFYNTCIALKFKNIILWGGNYYSDFLPISRCWFVWDKEMTGNFSEAEMAWTSFEKGGIRVFKYLWNGLSREGSRELEGTKRMHPTQKPVGLAMMIFQRFDYLKTIFDGFLGSGTTMVAAHQLNRKCYGMEIDPKYCQIIIDRMLKLDNTLEIKRNGQPYNICDKTVKKCPEKAA